MKKVVTPSTSRRQFLRQSAFTLTGFFIVPRHVLGGHKADGTKYLPPSDKISLGFIGCGKQGRGLSRAFLNTKEINITAISEVYTAKRQLMVEHIKTQYKDNTSWGDFPGLAEYNDFRELLSRKDIDAVVIATPDHWHGVMAVKAAEAGKDIYCEKPLALTVKEGRAMVTAARKYNRVFQTGNMQRSWKEFRQAVELIRNGYIGKIKSIKVNIGAPPKIYDLPEEPIPQGLDWTMWLGPNTYKPFNPELAPPITKDVFPNWRLYKEFGGGMVTDWGAHMFDIAQWALDMDDGGPVKFYPPDGQQHKHLTMVYKNGVTMTHEPWEWNNAVWFTGTEGELKVGRGKLETTPATLKDRVIGTSEKHVYYSENHYTDFLNAMRKRTNPISDVEIGHRTASLCNIANIAYALNRPLTWNPKKEQFKKDNEANALLGRPLLDEWRISL